MATIFRKGISVTTYGQLPEVGTQAPTFYLVDANLTNIDSRSYLGKKVILNVFPSIDTPTCASSVREFEKLAKDNDDVVVICVSADLPFALGRFCVHEDIGNIRVASSFRSTFGSDYGLTVITGALTGLLSRAVVVIDEQGFITYTEQVRDISDEPNYTAAMASPLERQNVA